SRAITYSRSVIEITRRMPFRHLLIQLAPGAVDLSAALHGGTLTNFLGPAQYMGIAVRFEEFRRLVYLVSGHPAVPGPDRHIGDAVLLAGNVAVIRQLAIEHIQLPLDLHG